MKQCDQDIFETGEHISTIINLTSKEIEEIIVETARLSGQRVDWHYIGGRACVRVIGDVELAKKYLRELLSSHNGNYRFTTDNDSVIPIGLLVCDNQVEAK